MASKTNIEDQICEENKYHKKRTRERENRKENQQKRDITDRKNWK